jgi:acyl-coenzyme A synthetase/AMP-(fatty) acid ligase
VSFVEEHPMTASGKIQKLKLPESRRTTLQTACGA